MTDLREAAQAQPGDLPDLETLVGGYTTVTLHAFRGAKKYEDWEEAVSHSIRQAIRQACELQRAALSSPEGLARPPTRIWIDTEFNEFRGALISMALVDEDGRSFYEVLACPDPGSWVAANVMPILGQNPISEKEFKLRLQDWLRPYGAVHIVADWPEDIEHFCHALITGPGFRLDTPLLTMEVRRDLEGISQLPHNALSDAKANRLAHLALDAAAGADQELG